MQDERLLPHRPLIPITIIAAIQRLNAKTAGPDTHSKGYVALAA